MQREIDPVAVIQRFFDRSVKIGLQHFCNRLRLLAVDCLRVLFDRRNLGPVSGRLPGDDHLIKRFDRLALIGRLLQIIPRAFDAEPRQHLRAHRRNRKRERQDRGKRGQRRHKHPLPRKRGFLRCGLRIGEDAPVVNDMIENDFPKEFFFCHFVLLSCGSDGSINRSSRSASASRIRFRVREMRFRTVSSVTPSFCAIADVVSSNP